MAYTVFPKSAKEIRALKTDKTKIQEILQLYTFLTRKYKMVSDPINIDPNKISVVNVTRDLQPLTEITAIKTASKLSSIKIKFGNGSKGGRGANNKGNLFERQYVDALRDFHAGEDLKDKSLQPSIEGLYKMYKLSRYKDLEVEAVGELNVRRPLIFGPDIVMKASGQQGNNVGPIVTDITLRDKKGGKPVLYLSLKMSGTTTFFNVGVKTILTTQEIKSGVIKNPNGNRLLKMFGVDKDDFCEIFNGKMKKGYSKNVWPSMSSLQKNQLEKLLQSGIGHGYHVIHRLGGTVKSTKIDESYMRQAAKPTSLNVYYGGMGGNGKRIDMEIITGKYLLKLNIRDTQGGDGYPTRLMGDFKYL